MNRPTLTASSSAPIVRARICAGLGFLGIELEDKRNASNEGVISATAGRVPVRVIRTDDCTLSVPGPWT